MKSIILFLFNYSIMPVRAPQVGDQVIYQAGKYNAYTGWEGTVDEVGGHPNAFSIKSATAVLVIAENNKWTQKLASPHRYTLKADGVTYKCY